MRYRKKFNLVEMMIYRTKLQKQIQIYLFLLFFNVTHNKSSSFWNEAEENLTKALIENLEIRQWILVNKLDKTVDDLNLFKNFLKYQKPLAFFSLTDLKEYFFKENFSNVNTLIVVEVSNIRDFINYINSIKSVSILCKISFTVIFFYFLKNIFRIRNIIYVYLNGSFL